MKNKKITKELNWVQQSIIYATVLILTLFIALIGLAFLQPIKETPVPESRITGFSELRLVTENPAIIEDFFKTDQFMDIILSNNCNNLGQDLYFIYKKEQKIFALKNPDQSFLAMLEPKYFCDTNLTCDFTKTDGYLSYYPPKCYKEGTPDTNIGFREDLKLYIEDANTMYFDVLFEGYEIVIENDKGWFLVMKQAQNQDFYLDQKNYWISKKIFEMVLNDENQFAFNKKV